MVYHEKQTHIQQSQGNATHTILSIHDPGRTSWTGHYANRSAILQILLDSMVNKQEVSGTKYEPSVQEGNDPVQTTMI